MKLISILIVSSCFTLLSACTSTSSEEGKEIASTNKEKRICTKEKKTGSNISRKVCRTPSQIQADIDDAKEMSAQRKYGATN